MRQKILKDKSLFGKLGIERLLSSALVPTLLLTSLAGPAKAEEGLSLQGALSLAYQNNPQMIVAREEVKASKGRWIQGEALPNPTVEVEVGGLKKSEGSRKGSMDSFSIKQPLDVLGTRFLGASMAKDEVRIAKKEIDLIWAKVRARIIELYSTILAQSQALEVANDNLDVTRNFFTKVEIRYQSGKGLKSDVIRARIELSNAENNLLISEKELKVSQGELNLALGRAAEQGLVLSDSLNYEALHYQYETIKGEALLQRADLKQEEIRLSSRKKGFWKALLKVFLPEMAVGLQRTTVEYENDTSLILEASYPLWGFNFGEVKEAKAEKNIQQVKLEAFKNAVGLDVYTAFLEAELSDKQVQIQEKTLEESNELLRQISTQYQEGQLSFISYLDNVKTIKQTRVAYLDALKNYKARVASLERAIQSTPFPGEGQGEGEKDE